MLEYGHILHWRIFDINNFNRFAPDFEESLYEWFYKKGYHQNVYERMVRFRLLEPGEQIHYLKERFAEDYRIMLNCPENNEHNLSRAI